VLALFAYRRGTLYKRAVTSPSMQRVAALLALALCVSVIGVVGLASDDPSRYVPTEQWRSDGTGSLYISVLCHHSLFSQLAFIRHEGESWAWPIWITLSPDGTWEGRLPAGRYDVWLLDGNGGHSEWRYGIEVFPDYQTVITFIGHAVSGRGDIVPATSPTPSPTPTPTVTPTVVPTTEPTVVPTITPTPTVTPDPCHWEWVCVTRALLGIQCPSDCRWVRVCPS